MLAAHTFTQTRIQINIHFLKSRDQEINNIFSVTNLHSQTNVINRTARVCAQFPLTHISNFYPGAP